MTSSPEGRRVLVAEVTGSIGERIQAWRLRHDPDQARRIPPHTTLAYWATVAPDDEDAFDAQVRHAFPSSIDVTLGDVHTFDNPDQTFFVDVHATADLNAARQRLFDGMHFTFPEQRTEWDWHVTVVRYGRKVGREAILPHIDELSLHDTWTIDRIVWLELAGGVYRPIKAWELD